MLGLRAFVFFGARLCTTGDRKDAVVTRIRVWGSYIIVYYGILWPTLGFGVGV